VDTTSERTIALPAGEGPLDNPLKGWCTYTIQGELHQPYSMVYRYVTWKELEPQEGSYQFDAWERRTWNDALSKSKHVVLRVHLDYPGSPSGIPDWLLAKGLKTRPYSDYGGGRSPDYDDPNLVAGLERLIAAMGARYDRNPRVAFIALGLLGFWGEWHTYPHEDWFASAATQQRVVTAYHRVFKHKMLMGRSAAGCLGQQPWLGYHDDMFPADTDGPEDWKFLPKMRQAGRMENWKTAVIGGEMEPRAAPRWLGSGYPTTKATIETGHFTWIGPYNPGMEREQTAEFVARSQEMVRRMGYQFALQELRYMPQVALGGKLRLTLRGKNEGVAPFYYAWPVRLALLNARHEVVETVPLQTDIRAWLPGEFMLHATPTLHAKPGQYRLALGILDPYTGRPALKFANALPYFQGWTVLADLRILS
jgi:hypothetical protein